MPMKKDRFYINFYLKDWVISTQTLSTLQKGAYWCLLTNMYLNEEGIVYEKHIPHLLQLKGKNLNNVMEVIKPYLIQVSDNPVTYTQKKVQSTILEINTKSKINSKNGKLGMQKRWHTKHNKNLTDKQTTNNHPNNDTITPPYRHDKQTIDNKHYLSMSEEERKRKENIRQNAINLGNGV
jgi:uncharacterized protein YdaU (DUF1376 family)